MPPTTARQLADGFLAFCYEHGDWISNLKLNKLLYYAQGWWLAEDRGLLFDDPIQAWVHGPVVPTVYHAFKGFAYRPIILEPPPDTTLLPEDVRAHVAEVWGACGHLSAYDLELATHREPPWLNARKGLAADEPSQNVISPEDMRAYFKTQMA